MEKRPKSPTDRVANCLVGSLIGAAYVGCLAPVLLEGLSWGSVGGVFILGILVTYAVTLFKHDLMVFANRVARVLERLNN